MKTVAKKIGKIFLVFYIAVGGIYFMYLQSMNDEKDTYEPRGPEAFNVKRNFNAANTGLVNSCKAMAWPYFLFASE